MKNKIFRAFSRVAFHALRFGLRFVEIMNSRLYMTYYLKLLNTFGLVLNGKPRYISAGVKFDDFNKISLGERVVISEKVIFLTHDYSLTTGLIAIDKKPNTDMAFIKPIVIGNNVFIGMGAIILPGTIIEDNVIIGAGSVVRGNVPTNSIFLGNPAILICSLKEKSLGWNKDLKKNELRVD